MHVYDRKLADIAGWKSHKKPDMYSALTAIIISLPLLPALSHPFSVSHSHILSLAPICSFSRSLLHTHTFLSVFFLSGSLKVNISLCPMWRASRHMTHHQSLLIPSPSQVIWREGFSDGTIHARKCTFLCVFVFLQLVWGECDCRSGGHQGAASPSADLTDSFLCLDIWRQLRWTFSSTSLFHRNNLA